MASKFGRNPYGQGAYSRDYTKGRVEIAARSGVAISAHVRAAPLIRIDAGSAVAVTGRLLWDHVPVEPCEGQWTPLVNTPCRRAA